jgi:hypothetical protein
MEILGLLDTLESMILEGFKIPFTKKTLINEEQVLDVLDKIKLVVQGGGNVIRPVIDTRSMPPSQKTIDFIEARKDVEKVKEGLPVTAQSEDKATEIIESAYKIAKEVRMGADKYADEVLSNLEATSSRILRAVKAGRTRLGKFVTGTSQESGTEEK